MFLLPEGGYVLDILTPQHTGAVTGTYISAKNMLKLYFIIQVNNAAAATANDFHLYKATAVAATGEVVDQTVAKWWDNHDLATNQTLTTQTGGATFASTVAQTKQMLVLQIDPEDFPGYDCFTVKADAGGATNFMSCLCIGVPRYAQATLPSAITD